MKVDKNTIVFYFSEQTLIGVVNFVKYLSWCLSLQPTKHFLLPPSPRIIIYFPTRCRGPSKRAYFNGLVAYRKLCYHLLLPRRSLRHRPTHTHRQRALHGNSTPSAVEHEF